MGIKIVAVLTLFLVIIFVCTPVKADNFSAAPPPDTIVKETEISFSLTTPSNKVFINATEYDAQQMIRSIALDFVEPITYVSCLIDYLKDKPFVANAVDTIPIQYYSIRFNTGLIDKIANITLVFAIQTNISLGKNVEPTSLMHYQYVGDKFEACSTEKIGQDGTFVYYQTETKPSPYYAVAGRGVLTIPWFMVVILTVIVGWAGLYLYRRHKTANFQDKVKP